MKLIDAVGQNRHNILRGDGSGRARRLRGGKFYTWFDKVFGIPALEVQTPETENNMVSRNTTPKNDIYTQTSGVYHFCPEKTEDAEDISISSAPQLLGQGGFNPFLIPPTPLPALTYTNDKARTDHSGQLPICGPLAQPGQSSRLAGRAVAGSNPAGALVLAGAAL